MFTPPVWILHGPPNGGCHRVGANIILGILSGGPQHQLRIHQKSMVSEGFHSIMTAHANSAEKKGGEGCPPLMTRARGDGSRRQLVLERGRREVQSLKDLVGEKGSNACRAVVWCGLRAGAVCAGFRRLPANTKPRWTVLKRCNLEVGAILPHCARALHGNNFSSESDKVC